MAEMRGVGDVIDIQQNFPIGLVLRVAYFDHYYPVPNTHWVNSQARPFQETIF
jgi:hypothetical protein